MPPIRQERILCYPGFPACCDSNYMVGGGRVLPFACTFARAKRRLFRLPLPSVLEPLLAPYILVAPQHAGNLGGRGNPADAERTREPGIRVRRAKSTYCKSSSRHASGPPLCSPPAAHKICGPMGHLGPMWLYAPELAGQMAISCRIFLRCHYKIRARQSKPAL
jgi:hypothetical protein